MTATALRRRKAGIYGVEPFPGGPYYGIAPGSGAELIFYTWHRDEGETVRGTVTMPVGLNVPNKEGDIGYLNTDPTGRVADGAVYIPTSTGLYVFEPSGYEVHAIAALPSRVVTIPIYVDGWVYWVEIRSPSGAGDETYKLMRARTDLSSVEEVGSSTAAYPSSIDVDQSAKGEWASTTAYNCWVRQYIGGFGGGVQEWLYLRFDLATGALEERIAQPAFPTHGNLGNGVPRSASSSYVLGNFGAQNVLTRGDESGGASAHWPTSADWLHDDNDAPQSLSLSRDGAWLCVYWPIFSGTTPQILVGPSEAPFGSSPIQNLYPARTYTFLGIGF